MTMRLGKGVAASKFFRSKTWCQVIHITRKDGTVYRFTTHDKAITIAGEDYSPVKTPGLSNERRQAGMSDSTQDLFGVIDSTLITEDDLNARKFTGAKVIISVVNWRWPWRNYYSLVRWVSGVSRDANAWKFETVGLTKTLVQPSGGRFGGYHTLTCPYKLFDTKYCRAATADVQTGCAVATVTGAKWQFTASSFTNGFANDWYRDGEIEWTTGDNAGLTVPIAGYEDSSKTITLLIPTPKPITVGDTFTARPGCDGVKESGCLKKFFESISDSGTSSGSNSSTTLNDTTKSWTVNAFVDMRVLIVRGTGAGQSAIIISNSATQLVAQTLQTVVQESGNDANGSTSTTLATSVFTSWVVNEFFGSKITILSGTGVGQTRTIAANTSTIISLTTAWTTTPDATSTWRITREGDGWETTPDSTSVYRIGVPNILQFGGSPYEPGSGQALEIPR